MSLQIGFYLISSIFFNPFPHIKIFLLRIYVTNSSTTVQGELEQAAKAALAVTEEQYKGRLVQVDQVMDSAFSS